VAKCEHHQELVEQVKTLNSMIISMTGWQQAEEERNEGHWRAIKRVENNLLRLESRLLEQQKCTEEKMWRFISASITLTGIVVGLITFGINMALY